MLITLVATQYIARPLGTVSVNQANISGIIHSIMLFMDCCLGSAIVVGVIIFCCMYMDTPTRIGITGSGSLSLIQRKPSCRGSASWINAQG